MVTHIARFEYIITDSELEALVLECNLIKEHRPKYNTMLMDDKTYPYIKVTINEPYPRVLFSRMLKKIKPNTTVLTPAQGPSKTPSTSFTNSTKSAPATERCHGISVKTAPV